MKIYTTGRPQTRPDTKANQHKRTHDRLRYYQQDGIDGWAKTALTNAKRRARKRGIACTLVIDDVLAAARNVTHCPILGLELQYSRGQGRPSGHSASIDRLDNEDDYSPDNCGIISHRANMLKSNLTPQELIAIGKYADVKLRKHA